MYSSLLMKPHLVVIDGLSFFFRAFHAVRLLTRADGLPTNALYGFTQMLLKVIDDLKPDLCVVAMDSITPTFRKTIDPNYKAHRPSPPAEMLQQLPHFEPLIMAFDAPAIRAEGFEADDVIAALVEKYRGEYRITIVSSDKDLMGLIGGDVVMLDTMKNATIGVDAVHEKFGVSPEKVPEVLALIGDSSDNIPGVAGVGPKTAAELISAYGSVQGVYDHVSEIEKPKLRESLLANRADAFLSRQLVELRTDVPLPADTNAFHWMPDWQKVKEHLLTLGFKTLAVRAAEKANRTTPNTGNTLPSDTPPTAEPLSTSAQSFKHDLYETITTPAQLQAWHAKIKQARLCAVDTETTSLAASSAQLVGISLAVGENAACYIPLAHTQGDGLAFGAEVPTQLPVADVLAVVGAIFADASITKVAHNWKYDWMVFKHAGVPMDAYALEHFHDTLLMSYVLDGGLHNHGLDELARLHLHHTMVAFKDVCGTGQKQITFDHVPIDAATRYAVEDADAALRLFTLFNTRLEMPEHARQKKVYEKIERPLIPTLARMEEIGVLVDKNELARLSLDLGERLAALETEIFVLAGGSFNINSPKQLGEVLFGRLGLTLKGKTPKSTAADVLEDLALEGHAVAQKVLDYRQLAKLRSTYTEALQHDINPISGRVHTKLNTTGAATGRFSSNDPNLQNIPIRTEEGRKIRKCFIAKPGCVLMSADYSQIELRLMAHLADDAVLKEAFMKDTDIHRFTAAQIFGVEESAVSNDQRRIAKTINFGLLYGMGAQSLGNQIGVSKTEAATFIENYFKRFANVRGFMDKMKEFVKTHGYVETLLGRRVHMPGAKSMSGMERANAERAAINAPLQGSNADIIKLAMPRIDKALVAQNMSARLLLQVHDELVLEVPETEVDEVKALVKHEMEQVVKIAVPLKVEIGTGKNWDEAH